MCSVMSYSSPLGSSVCCVSRQDYWNGLPLPSPGDPPDSGLELGSPVSLALAGRFFTTVPPGKPQQRPSKT